MPELISIVHVHLHCRCQSESTSAFASMLASIIRAGLGSSSCISRILTCLCLMRGAVVAQGKEESEYLEQHPMLYKVLCGRLFARDRVRERRDRGSMPELLVRICHLVMVPSDRMPFSYQRPWPVKHTYRWKRQN